MPADVAHQSKNKYYIYCSLRADKYKGRVYLRVEKSLSIGGRWSYFFSIYNILSQQIYSFHTSNLPANSKQLSK